MLEKLKIAWYSSSFNKIPSIYGEVLMANEYYKNLDPKLRREFERRTYINVRSFTWEAVKFENIKDEMKILIASALVQITFGLEKFILRRFKKILISPNKYRFKDSPTLHGHVDFNYDIITVAWPSVKEGFLISDDSFNVALHELGHAIQREDFDRSFLGKFFNRQDLENWRYAAEPIMYDVRSGKNTFIKPYGGTNLVEMFAVTIETFFEQSHSFKENMPAYYELICRLLKQDPTNVRNPISEIT